MLKGDTVSLKCTALGKTYRITGFYVENFFEKDIICLAKPLFNYHKPGDIVEAESDFFNTRKINTRLLLIEKDKGIRL